MRKLTIVLGLYVITCSSCLKEYECTCTSYAGGNAYKTWVDRSNDVMTKGEAETWCKNKQVLGGSAEVKCHLN